MENIKVYVRVKPSNIKATKLFNVITNDFDNTSTLLNLKTGENFSYGKKIFLLTLKYYIILDEVIPTTSSTKDIFDNLFKNNIINLLNGINLTIFAYGQTSTGKTYTMQGDIPYNEGIIPLTLKEIFNKINSSKDILNSKITVSFIEIYNESINDLLNTSKINLELRETLNKEIIVNNLTEIKVNNHEEALNLLLKGNESKIVASTKLNEKSSRSHSIFRLNLELTKNKENKIMDIKEKITLKSHINLIDLAGSENSSKTGCVGQRLKEGSNINKSLLALSNVINKLNQNNANMGGSNFFINYRDSKLTRLLQNSLGGNSKTAIICTITDDSDHYTETMNTLHFGNKAKNIKTVVKVNEIKNQDNKEMMLENKRLKKKVKELEKELTTQKKLKLNELLNYSETNNINDQNLISPPKINLNNSFLLCNMPNNTNNEDLIINNKFSSTNSSLSLNRTQLALNNMERELCLLKKYLLTDQKENMNKNAHNNSYLETFSIRSSDICRNLMSSKNGANLPNFHESDYSQNLKLIKYSKKINICNVDNFVLNEKNNNHDKNDKIKQLEEENNILKYELSLIRNINLEPPLIDLDESLIDKNIIINNDNERQEYFLNNGRKVQLSKFSKNKFIKNLSNKIKNFNKNENDDIQILIQLNQTIKNLNQNIISDINKEKNNGMIKKKSCIGKENLLLNRKRLNKIN